MTKPEPPVRWAPRLHPSKLTRLYTLDAQGILDTELIDDVGYTLYSRCRSIIHVTDAMNGTVHCPHCDTLIPHHPMAVDVLVCSTCNWHAAWSDYANTYRTQELGAGGAADIFQTFIEQWEQVGTAREKMVLIDQLVHRWHWETQRQRPTFGLGRPTGVNLIEGNKEHVLAVLDTLTYGTGSTRETQTTKVAWRAHWQEVQERHATGRAARQVKRNTADPSEST